MTRSSPAGALFRLLSLVLLGATGAAEPTPALSMVATSSMENTSPRVVIGDRHRVTTIREAIRWDAGRTYELAGSVVVAEGGTLTIEAGARVEARPGARLDITREGRLIADGTLLQPIVLTCSSVPKYEGCWGGVAVRGFAQVNYGFANSPAARSGAAAGCLQVSTGDEAYGGCDDADSSGVLRYVRVEYAARGLELQGVGSKTRVDFVQVNRSLGDGVTIAGGTVDVRHLFLTANGGYGLLWRSGWRGRGQFITVQQDALRNRGGILGSNAGGGTFTASPRSAPTLFNVTVVSPSALTNPFHADGPSAMHLTAGTGGVIKNALVFASEIALDVDDAETCEARNGIPGVSFATMVVAGTSVVGSPDADAGTCGSYGTPNVEGEWLADPATTSVIVTDPVVVAALIRSATSLSLPDLRPASGSSATTIALSAIPVDGFFDAGAQYAGAVAPAELVRNSIPWYAGWSVPAPYPPLPGAATGIVASAVRGPFPGALVSSSFGSAISTTAGGQYTLGLPAGDHLLSTSSLPIGCSAAPLAIAISSGTTTTANIAAECTVTSNSSVGALHACAQGADARIQCWGQNDYGMVGDGTVVSPRLLPGYTAGNLTFAAGSLSSGLTHTCALRSGAALCWGLNFFGALGLGTSGFLATTPVAAGNSGTPSFASISAGGYHTCALTGTGEAWCWGWNQEGQVGSGSTAGTIPSPVPVAAGPLRFTQITAGDSHTCAIEVSGTTYCWGGNGRGELGSDPAVVGLKSLTPIAVPTTLVFARIDAGTLHTCGVTAAGEAYCWGTRETGQLGDGQTAGYSVGPVAVSTAVRFSQLSAGGHTTCGVSTTGQLYCWGAGTSGALGNGTQTIAQATPVAVAGSLTATGVTVNLSEPEGATVCSVTVAGDVYCWGSGVSGKLGTGTVISLSTVPVQVLIRGPF